MTDLPPDLISKLRAQRIATRRKYDNKSQWNTGEDDAYIPYPVAAQAFDPKVIIRNDVFPRPWEVYNCTSCKNAEPEHPAHKANMERFRVKCKSNGMWNEGPRHDDINCPMWDRQVFEPKHGLIPGIESGPYDRGDRR